MNNETINNAETTQTQDSPMASEIQNALDQMSQETTHQTDISSYSPNLPLGSGQNISIDSMPEIFVKIDNMMGSLLETLATIDSKFKSASKSFFASADKISKKKNIKDEDLYAIYANLIFAGTIEAAGNLWRSILSKKAIAEVKRLLNQEAQGKLQFLYQTKQQMDISLEICKSRFLENYYLCNETKLKSLAQYRTALYHSLLTEFLITTYEAALEGKFQNALPFPTLDKVNRYLLYYVLNCREDLLDDAAVNERADFMRTQFNCVKNCIGIKCPQLSYYLLAADAPLFSIGCYDLYPLIYENPTEVIWSDKANLILESESVYEIFKEIENKRQNLNNTHTPILEGLEKNSAYSRVHKTLEALNETRQENDERLGYQIFIVALLGLMGFLGTWLIYDLKWYGCLVISLIIMAISNWILPISKGLDKAKEKMARIEKNGQVTLQTMGGYKKMLDLYQYEKESNLGCLLAIIFGIIGAAAGPIGCFIGIGLGLFLGEKKQDYPIDYSYKHLRVKPTVKTTIFMWVLIIADGFLLYRMFF